MLLAVAAVATAWSSYQSARWSGVQANDYSEANAARVESARASTLAGQQTQVDVLTFTQWVDAFEAGDKRLASFYFNRFRDELRPAVRAWIATRPLKTADAPPTPFAMPEYQVAKQVEARRLENDADRAGAAARTANQRADNYVLAVVLFAVALFFAGISTKLSAPRQRATVLALGYVLFDQTETVIGNVTSHATVPTIADRHAGPRWLVQLDRAVGATFGHDAVLEHRPNQVMRRRLAHGTFGGCSVIDVIANRLRAPAVPTRSTMSSRLTRRTQPRTSLRRNGCATSVRALGSSRASGWFWSVRCGSRR